MSATMLQRIYSGCIPTRLISFCSLSFKESERAFKPFRSFEAEYSCHWTRLKERDSLLQMLGRSLLFGVVSPGVVMLSEASPFSMSCPYIMHSTVSLATSSVSLQWMMCLAMSWRRGKSCWKKPLLELRPYTLYKYIFFLQSV